MAKAATVPKTKHADRMILPSSSQKYSWMYLRVCRSWETNHYKSPISSSFFFLLLSHTKLLTSIFYQLKQVIELLNALNNITFIIVAPSACQSARVEEGGWGGMRRCNGSCMECTCTVQLLATITISFLSISFHFTFHKFVYVCRHCPIITNMYQVTLSCSTSQRSKKKQGEMPLPSLSPIPSLNSTFYMGWGWGWVMAFPLVSLLFWEVEYDRLSLNTFLFFRENLLLSCKNWNHVESFLMSMNTEGNDVTLWCSAVALRVSSYREMGLSVTPILSAIDSLVLSITTTFVVQAFEFWIWIFVHASFIIWIFTVRILNQPYINWCICMYGKHRWMTYPTIPPVQSESLPCSSDITRFELI